VSVRVGGGRPSERLYIYSSPGRNAGNKLAMEQLVLRGAAGMYSVSVETIQPARGVLWRAGRSVNEHRYYEQSYCDE